MTCFDVVDMIFVLNVVISHAELLSNWATFLKKFCLSSVRIFAGSFLFFVGAVLYFNPRDAF